MTLVLSLLILAAWPASRAHAEIDESIGVMADVHASTQAREDAILAIDRVIMDRRPYDQRKVISSVIQTFPGDDVISNNASWILVTIGTAAVPALLDAIKQPKPVGERAATALGYFEGAAQEQIYPEVLRLLHSASPDLRLNALSELDRAGWVFALRHATAPAEAIAAALTQSLDDSDPSVRVWAMADLKQMGLYAAPSVDMIVEKMSDPDSEMHGAAAEALGSVGPAAAPRIAKMLSKSSGDARLLTAIALARADHAREEAIPPLVEAVSDRSGTFRVNALDALAEMGPHAKRAQAAVVKALHDSQEGVQCAAVWTLQTMGSPPASIVPKLRKIVRDQPLGCAQNAIVLLGTIGPAASAAIPELVDSIHGTVGSVPCNPAEALAKIGPASVPALLKVARERDDYRRAWASWALAQLAANPKVPLKAIGDALCDPAFEVAFRTKEGLERAGVKTGRMAQFFDARKQEFRSKTCVGSYQPPVASVPNGLTQPIDEVALEREIIPDLISRLNGAQRQEALRTLSELGPYAAAAVPTLLGNLPKADQNDRRMIASMLGALCVDTTPCVPVLVELLKDSDSGTSEAALGSLARLGDSAKEAVPAMLERLEAGKISSWSEESIIQLRGPVARAALPYYRKLTTEEDEGKAARGVRMMMLIASDSAPTMQAALAEAGRGSALRRCLIAGEMLKALGDMASVRNLPVLDDASCRKNLQAQPELSGVADALLSRPGPDSYPHLKIHLSLAKKTFYAGEAIEVTPNIPDWPQSTERFPPPSFYRDGPLGALDLRPEIRTSTGVLVEAGGASESRFGFPRRPRRGAEPSWRMGNMMANGIVMPRAGSAFAIGRPATVFIRHPGRYRLSFPKTLVHVGSSTGPLKAVFAGPVDVDVVPATDEFVDRTMRDIESELTSNDAMDRGWATERLRNLNADKAVPILLGCLEDEYRNVLEPALFGLLEFSRPEVVAREIRKAFAQGRPTRDSQMWWYAEVLARTEHGWPGTDAISRTRVDANSTKWRLLLERRERLNLESRILSPDEALEGISTGLISPATRGACDAAWKGLLDGDRNKQFRFASQIVDKCGSKDSSAVLWQIARNDKFDSVARGSASRKLYDLGDKDALNFILADMAAPHPGLYHTIQSLPIIEASPKAVADIVLNKMASDDGVQTRFAAELLWGLDSGFKKGIDLPLDPAKLRAELLGCKENSCDSVVWGHVARYLSTRSPKDSLAIVEAMLQRCGQDKFAGCAGPIQILATLPIDVGGPLVRRRLNSSDPKIYLDMLRELASVTPEQARPYFGDILTLFERDRSDEVRGPAVAALQRISKVPSSQFPMLNGYAVVDNEMASRWIKEWEAWQTKNGVR